MTLKLDLRLRRNLSYDGPRPLAHYSTPECRPLQL